MTYRLITEESALRGIEPHLRSQTRIALDCEAAGFHRYSDRLCLLQVSTSSETFLIDPLEFDPSSLLRPVLEDPGVQVFMHGADFDLRLLQRDLRIRIRGLFDTQIAATLLGAEAVGLAALLQDLLGIGLSKAHQRADWAQRPLPDALLEYAAADTGHLVSLGSILGAKLREAGREAWAQEEFKALEENRWVPEEEEPDPVRRFKGARHLTPRQVMALRGALKWRDRIAREKDKAPFRVVGDSTLAAIVMERPESLEELVALKGMSPRLARAHGGELLAELRRVKSLPAEDLVPFPRGDVANGQGRPSPQEEALAEKIRSLRTTKAEEVGIDRGVLLSNAQISDIVKAHPSTPEALREVPSLRSWQIQLLEEGILGILTGTSPGRGK